MSAELADLRLRLGTVGVQHDGLLQTCLDVASAWVDARVYALAVRPPEVDEAILLLASRLYARRNTPEGIAGWPELGIVTVTAADPDVLALLERHEDYQKVGLA